MYANTAVPKLAVGPCRKFQPQYAGPEARFVRQCPPRHRPGTRWTIRMHLCMHMLFLHSAYLRFSWEQLCIPVLLRVLHTAKIAANLADRGRASPGLHDSFILALVRTVSRGTRDRFAPARRSALIQLWCGGTATAYTIAGAVTPNHRCDAL